MTAISVSAPFPILTDIDGSPLDAGYVYIGQANLDPAAFPKAAYWDASLTTPAAQPIRTTGGYPVRNGSPARIYTDGDYSIRINNKNGTLVYSSPASTDRLDSWQIGYDGGTVQDVLDGAKSLQDYAALRAYTGRAKRIYITGLLVTAKPSGIAGVFQHDPTDTTSLDNGGTIVVDAVGRRWKRDFDGEIFAKWFGVVANGTTVDTDAFNRLLAYANSKKAEIKLPAGDILLSEAIIIPDNALRKISGEGQQNSRLVFDITSGVAITVASYYTRPVCFEGFDVILKNQANTVSGLKVSFGNTGSWGGGMIADRFNVLDFTGTVVEFVEAFSSNFRMCEFRGGLQGGVKTAKLLKSSYTTYFGANNSFTNCVFHVGKIGFQNFGGTTYDFNSCTFENLDLFANVKQLAGLSMYGSWESCWFEDIANGIVNAEINETTLLPLSPVQNKANISRLYFYANMTSSGVNPIFLDATVEPFLYDKFRLDSGINKTYQGVVHYEKYTFNNGLPNNVEDLRLISQIINITEVNYKPFDNVLRNGQYIVTVEVTGFNNYKMYAVFVSGGFKTPLTLVGTVTDANAIGSSYKIQLLWADDIQITAQAYGKGLVSLNAYISFVPFMV